MATYFFQQTSFDSENDLGGRWKRGAVGSLLQRYEDGTGCHVRFPDDWTGSMLGDLLAQSVADIASDMEYELMIRVRRGTRDHPSETPTLAWQVQGKTLDYKTVPEGGWQLLSWRFTAQISGDDSLDLKLLGKDLPTLPGAKGGNIVIDHIAIQPAQARDTFDGLAKQVLEPGESLSTDTMLFTLLEGSGGKAGIDIYSERPDMREGPCLGLCLKADRVTPDQHVKLAFEGYYSSIRFAWTWLQRGGHIQYIGWGGKVIADQEVPTDPYHINISFTAPANERILGIQLTCCDYSFLDFFEFEMSPADDAPLTQ